MVFLPDRGGDVDAARKALQAFKTSSGEDQSSGSGGEQTLSASSATAAAAADPQDGGQSAEILESKSSGVALVDVGGMDDLSQAAGGSFHPVVYYNLASMPPPSSSPASPFPTGAAFFKLRFVSETNRAPIAATEAALDKVIARGQSPDGMTVVTDHNGFATFPLRCSSIDKALVSLNTCFDAHWGYRRDHSGLQSGDTIEVPAVDLSRQKDALRQLADATPRGDGAGIKIGVIDSGVGPHTNLPAAQISGDPDSLIGHGTHVAGIIAASGANGCKGVAPEAEIVSYNVFADPENPHAANYTIHDAIYQAVQAGCHLINLSLSVSGVIEPVVALAIESATDDGVLIFAAAGNSAADEPVFPARHSDCIAVTACGHIKGLPDAAHDHKWVTSNRSSHNSHIYWAGFSNAGTNSHPVDLIAPGVGIVSCVPGDDGHAPMSGTSMACPAAVGAAATILSSKKPDFETLTGRNRRDAMWRAIKSEIKNLDFPRSLQGHGLLPYGI